jgi:HD-like signal output (HDOD) protein
MSLSVWLKRIADKEMPAFRRTATDVMSAASDPEMGSDALGRVILKDPALTARVLRIANTVGYNPSGRRIQTISKAILQLGADAIRNICLGVALMESLLHGRRQNRVMVDLGRSVHAAMLARTLAMAQREAAAEEVFIAGLLYRVGNMVFWCFSEDEGVTLDAVLKPGMDEASAEKAILGFSLLQLSHALVDDWKLSSLLLEIYRGRKGTVAPECVLTAWRWCRVLESGWEAPKIRREVERLADWLKMDPASTTMLLAKVAREARETAVLFGSQSCAQTIPQPPEGDDRDLFARIAGSDSDQQESAAGGGLEESADRQLESLKSLAALSSEGRLDEMLAVLVSGLHEGLGMDRVVLCGIEPGDRIQGRMGAPDDEFASTFRFTLRRQMSDSLSRAMEQGGFVESFPSDATRRPVILPDSLAASLRGVPFLFGVLQMGGRTMGAVYADRATSGRALSESVVEGFRHLVRQANLLMGRAAANRGSGSTFSA